MLEYYLEIFHLHQLNLNSSTFLFEQNFPFSVTKKILIVLFLCVVTFTTSYQAFGTSIDFGNCYQSTNHHCIEYKPQLNQVPLGATSNMHVEIHLPANGANVIDGIFSQDNFTNLKQNPAVMAVMNIYTTTASPTLNYCPIALYILNNQGIPEYLNHFYNVTNHVDLTGYVYPDSCIIESGPNPINGHHVIPVPEFPQVGIIVLAIGILSLIIFTATREIKK